MPIETLKRLREPLLFALVGTLGFGVDSAVLYAVMSTVGLYAGRGVSFIAAVFATWLLNRLLTFSRRHSGLSILREFLVYGLLMMVGGAANLIAYGLCVAFTVTGKEYPILALAFGSLTGMIINLLTSRFILFRHAVAARDAG